MSKQLSRPAPKPCASCPYRRDVPSGLWAAQEYERLAHYDGEMHEQATGVFQCHQNDSADDKARLCAGWVACHGPENLLALRFAPVFGTMTGPELEATLDYTTAVPLFDSGAEAAEHGTRDIDAPSIEAEAAIEKITKRRKDIRYA